MTSTLPNPRAYAPPGFGEMFTPKLATVLREGYSAANFRADAIAGLTVAIVALPLSMAIAIGSGAKPENGLYTSIVGGFLISALGGSRFQVGGPAAAFITLVAMTTESFGLGGLMLASMMAGVLMLAIGYLRLGTYIKYIPHPVTIGFTSGIALIIFAGQIHDFFGLKIDREPAAFLPKLRALWTAGASVNPITVAVGVLCVGIILALRKLAPRFPGMIAAIILAALLTWSLSLPIETLGSRFGEVPSLPPTPAWPDFPVSRILELVPAAIAIALLGSIESLLSAVVADGMTGRRHRSNCELVAQGYANIACGLFGGLCATGTIARTATNIRARAHGPVSGMLHALFLLLFMLIAAPLMKHIPLAALAAVLITVAWNMVEKSQIAAILRHDRGEAAVLAATFLLTLFRDLTEGIAVGVTLGSILFMHRMAQLVEVTTHHQILDEDRGDFSESDNRAYEDADNGDVMVYRIAGPFFFGAADTVSEVLERLGQTPKNFILDLSAVPFIDTTGVEALAGFVNKARKSHARVYLVSVAGNVARALRQTPFSDDAVTFCPTVEIARDVIQRAHAE